MTLRSWLRVAALALAAILAGTAAACSAPRSGSDAVASSAPAGATVRETLTVGGRERSYLLRLPPRPAQRPALVVALHGRGGDGDAMRRLSGFDTLADRVGFLAVFPDAVDEGWADGRGSTRADRAHVDDVGFLTELIHTMVRDRGVDPQRVFIAGFSNGAFMAERFACDATGEVAAILAVAGTLGAGVACHPTEPVSVLQIAGTADPVVPFTGGKLHGLGTGSTARSAADTVAIWREAAHCPADTRSGALPVPADRPAGDSTAVTVDSFRPCDAGTAVEFYTVTGGGHTWPGGPQYLPAPVIGPTTHVFSATAVGWEFFAAHPRPRTP